MQPSLLLICVGAAGAIVCLGYWLVGSLDPYRSTVTARLKAETKTTRKLPRWKGSPGADPDQARKASSNRIKERLVPTREDERKRFQSRLVQAGIYGPTALSTYFVVKLCLMLVPPALGLVLALATPVGNRMMFVLGGCIIGLAGILLPSLWLERRIRQRHLLLRRSLPDMLDLMTVCLEGGLSLQGTLLRVGSELGMAHPVLAAELAIVQREMDLGVSVHVALQRLAERTGYEGFRRLTSCVRDAQRQGSDLAGALRIHSDTLRDQREAEGEEMAQKASVKILIPTLIFIFPAVFVVIAGPAAIRIHESFNQAGGTAAQDSP